MNRLAFILLLSVALPLVASESLRHEAYVWHRVWNEPVRAAVVRHGTNFTALVALAAEVSWRDRRPEVVRVAVDYPALAAAGRPVGLALRIGPWPGPFAADDKNTVLLADLAETLVREARAKQIEPCELQIDFDCAAAKLAGYQIWLTAIQRRLAPLPVTITALPSWLDAPGFKDLAARATNYVLQVHSLAQPKSYTAPFTLCDPAAAQSAVARAAQFGVPFRVALPTYGYALAFDRGGKFLGLSAEGPARSWPADAKIREVRADAPALAALVQAWTTNRPVALRGVIWYRLPVAVDNLNWRWPTLGAILAGRSPRESLRGATRRVEPGLVEISLDNDGDLDHPSRPTVKLRWNAARLVAGDGLRGFELAVQNASAAILTNSSANFRLPAGEQETVGWLRFDHDCEVQVKLEKN